jgi:hypothetical protein
LSKKFAVTDMPASLKMPAIFATDLLANVKVAKVYTCYLFA